MGELDKIPRRNGFADWTNTRILGTRTETRWKILYLIKEKTVNVSKSNRCYRKVKTL